MLLENNLVWLEERLELRNIKAVIEYDGTNYKGFQIQPNVCTIQMVLEKALERLTKERIKIIAAGRTDTGVHALGQVINFYTASTIPVERFSQAINSCLPGDIRVLTAELAAENFHARYSAEWKIYRYLIRLGTSGGVFWRNYALTISDDLDLEAMREAAHHLVGTHDFQSFCASGCEVQSKVRSIKICDLRQIKSGIELEIKADGFLYHMVRNIVGTLLQVGRGQRSPNDMPRILASSDRNQAGPTAPPQGLYLSEVGYPN